MSHACAGDVTPGSVRPTLPTHQGRRKAFAGPAPPRSVGRVIMWVNGAFGAGKTTTAAHLQPRLDASRVFDPESVGCMLAANLRDLAERGHLDGQPPPPAR